MKKIAADLIYTVDSSPIKDGVILLDDSNRIIALDKKSNHEASTLEYFKGTLIPGFINTHCHLELSHMKGMVNTGTSLIPFITSVVTKRDAVNEEGIQSAINIAEQEMWDGGIMAVGDISNVVDTFAVKQRSKMKFYTFVEMFDMFQAGDANNKFEEYKKVFDSLELKNGSQKSIVPHAPYSVSQPLFDLIQNATPNGNATISVHNQETPPENQLFLEGDGGFADWYASWNLSLDDFTTTGTTSIHYLLKNLNPNNRTLFVHNTLSTPADIQAAHDWSEHCYWASCPNANLYIENRLPNYQHFIDAEAKMTLGTDSLTSNWQLSILEEMKTIARYQSYVPFETLLKWATLNGAEALGFEEELGSISVGKRPGILLLENFDGNLNANTSIKRII